MHSERIGFRLHPAHTSNKPLLTQLICNAWAWPKNVTSQDLRMLSRSIYICQSLTLNFTIQASQFVRNVKSVSVSVSVSISVSVQQPWTAKNTFLSLLYVKLHLYFPSRQIVYFHHFQKSLELLCIHWIHYKHVDSLVFFYKSYFEMEG